MEGGDGTEISVSLNRVDATRDTVTVTIKPEESGLTVSPSSLTFSRSSLGPKFITVGTTTDSTYTGDRSRTLTLTTKDYATTMVTVDIIENTPQPIRLEVLPTELSLVRFTRTMIEVSVDVAADLTVKAEGAVRLAGDSMLVRTNLGGGNPLETEIQISGVSEGKGTVSFTVSGDRKATKTKVVSVTVTRPTLVISEVIPSNINLATREITLVTVSVSAVGDHRSTLKATMTGTGNVASVTPMEMTDIRAGTPATFTVIAGLAAGNTTLTLTASHSDYESASAEVDVRVDLRPIELSVEPSPLEVVIGTSTELTIEVSATEGVTLTVTVDRDGIIKELADEYLLTSGETSTEISVRGNTIGDTTLTIEATAEGYTSATTTVSIEVLDLLRIEADTDRLSLVEGGANTELRVSLNRIDAGRDEVEVRINLEGSGLTVNPSSLTFSRSSLSPQFITVETTNDSTYTGDSSRTLTLTAEGYATATVTVTIIEDDYVVSITLFDGRDRVELTEGEESSVTLRLTVSPPANRELSVNLRYTDGGALTGELSSVQPSVVPTVVTVPANAATHTFVILVVDDRIAAEGTRTANILLQQPGDGYTVSDTDNMVEVAVMDNDVATVSISPGKDVVKGDTIVFTVTLDLATDQATSISLTLTYNGDFFSPVESRLNLSDYVIGIGINLKLINRHKRNGKVYYYLDHYTNDSPDNDDRVTHGLLDTLLNNGNDTVDTQSDGHNGSDDARSVIIGDYALVLPTIAEIQDFFNENSNIPDGWRDSNGSSYWSATPAGSGKHKSFRLNRFSEKDSNDNSLAHVFFQVLTAQQTRIVDLPAKQLPMGTVMVEVGTIDVEDSITDGSLVASLVETLHPALTIGDPLSAKVIIHVMIPLSIEADPDMLSLVEMEGGASTQISVSLSRIDADRGEVEVSIDLEGSGLAVSTTLLTFNSTKSQTVTVTATNNDDEYMDNRSERLILTAMGYASATVTVEITDDELPPIELSVEPSPLKLVIGTPTELTIEVSATEGVTLTVTVDDTNIIEGLAAEYLLMSGETRTEITVRGDNIGDTTLRITATAEDYISATTIVSVEVLDLLRIEVEPATFELAEDASTQIRVRVNRVDAARDTVTVMIEPEGSGLTVSPSSLTFSRSSLGPQFITVETTTDRTYTGDRRRTLRLTADNYVTTMVMVDIIENTPQPIRLEVVGSTELSLVRFASTEITVRVGVAADLTVKAEGAVRLAGDRMSVSSNLGGENPLETEIEISGVSEGKGTVTFTVSGARKATDTVVVSVTVTRPTLVITEVSPSNINLLTRETTVVIVSVSAIGNHDSTLKATVTGTGNSVTPMEMTGVRVGTTTTFTVTAGLDAGNTTLTLTASHPLYDLASTEVTVNVSLRPLELSVEPSLLMIVTEMSAILTIEVQTTATMTISSSNTEIARVGPVAPFTLGERSSTKISIRGGNISDTTLTIEATAEGYTSATTTVRVVVLDNLRIVADTDRLSLMEMEGGASTQISVSLNRIDADRGEVEVSIDLEGSGLAVSTTLLTFRTTEIKTIVVTATNNDDKYMDNRSGTVTLTAMGYVTAMVTVEITDDELPPIKLSVEPSPLMIVTEMSAILTIEVQTTATIMISSSNTEIARVGPAAPFTLGERSSREISIRGGEVGATILTIEATAEGYATETTQVTVVVLVPLSIEAVPAMLNLVEGDSTQIRVSVSRIPEASSSVTVTINLQEESELILSRSSLTFSRSSLGPQFITVQTTNDNTYTGDSSRTLILTAEDYATATVTVTIIEDDYVVSITSFDGRDRVELTEGEESSVSLRLTVSPPANRELSVNLDYTNDVGALTGELSSVQPSVVSTVVTVPANAATHTFVIPVVDDRIAAEGTRTASIELQQPGDGYIVSDDNKVEVAVMDNDVATVSISPGKDVVKGDTIVFTVTLDLATDQATSISLTLTYNGDFFSPAESRLSLGNHANILLSLINRHKRNGKVYYYLDHYTNNSPDNNDQIPHALLDALLNNGNGTVDTQSDGHNGSDDERSVIIGDYALVLPTIAEIQDFFNENSNIPDGWQNNEASYWSATPAGSDEHERFPPPLDIPPLSDDPDDPDNSPAHVFFQVLAAQRTTIIDLPAKQLSMGTVMVKVETIDVEDSITDGSLVASLVETLHPALTIGDPSSAKVVIHALNPLRIEAVPDMLSLVEGASTQISVNLKQIDADRDEVEVSINLEGSGLAVSTTLLTFNSTKSQAVTVTATNNDDEYMDNRSGTVTLMAMGYTSATVTVEITDDELPPIGLSVEPSPLMIVTDMLKQLTVEVAVSEDADVTLTITVRDANIIESLAAEYLLMSGETSTEISVRGGEVGDTTLRITATAEGYATASTQVSVVVLDSLRIVANPVELSLVEDGDSTELRVSLNRIDAARDTVTVTIKPEGSGLTVSPPVLTFNTTELQSITVQTTTDSTYTGDRRRTLTLAARGYVTTMVTVDIIENTPQPIGLKVVGSTKLSLVRFTSTIIGVSVDIDADLTVRAEGAVRLVSNSMLVSSNLSRENPLKTKIEIQGESVGKGTVTFTVSGARKATDTVEVSVTVTRPTLVISEVSPSNINLLTRETTVVTVSVSAVGDHRSILTATVSDEAGSVVSVTPTERPDVRAGMSAIFTVTAGLDAGNTTLTLTATHPLYDLASAEVDVRVDLRPLELSVEPSPLEVVIGTSKILTIEVQTTATITIISDDDNIASVPESAAAFMLVGGAENSTRITVSGGNVDRTTLTITAKAEGYTSATTTVSIEVLDSLRIKAMPTTFELAEDASTQISVRVNRIDAARDTVTVTIKPEGSGLTVSPSSLTFSRSSLRPQFITVQTTTDRTYTGDRSRMLTLTARGYATTMVTVDIIENTLQQIGLKVISSTELSLVKFTSTEITVRVDIDADLMVKAEGAVRLVRAVPPNLTGGAEATQIQIEGESVGEGTVTFTVSGARKATDTVVVSVTVTRPTLVISEVSPSNINLLTRETTVVTVSAIGNPSSTLTATVTGTGNSVTPTEITDVPAGTPATFTVTAGLAAGDETLTLTASHPLYESASAEVDVRVDLRPLELSVEPSPLEVVIGTSKVLMIGVSATEGVTLTVTVDRDDRIKELAAEYLLTSGETRTEISVRGNNIGATTLTITAEAEGYTSATTTVSIEVLDSLRIKAMPTTFELAEDASTQISVRVNRIDAARDTVTVTIKPEGSGLTVSPSSLTFSRSSLRPQFITVQTTTDRTYTGDRSRMLTLTAKGYATTMVTVDIIENTLQSIILDGVPTELSLVRFTSTMIGVRVDIDADLMVKAEGAVSLLEESVPPNLTGGAEATQIQIEGESVGEGTVTFTVSGARKATDTVVVSVTVTRPRLVISEVSPFNINLLTRETTIVTVSVSAIGNHGSTLTATVSGTGNSVTPTEIIGVPAGTPAMFRVTAGFDAGTAMLMLTARHPDYDSTSTEVDVRVDLRPLELSVEPSPLEVVIGTSKILTIEVSATEGVTLKVTVDRDDRIRELADEYLLMNGEMSTTIEVIGNVIGDTTLTIEAEAEGYTSATTTVSIEVLDLLRIKADTDRLSLVEGGANAEIRVSLNRIDASRDEVEVRIDLEGSGLTVSSPSFTFSRSSLGPQFITVQTTTDRTYTGDRSRMLTLTARGYATATVTVDIIENTPQPIKLEVLPTELRLVRFTSTMIGVRVDIDADLMVKAEGAVRLVGDVPTSLIGSAEATQIQIEGESVGEGTVTFTVSGARKATDTVVVSVTVTRPRLVISEVSPSNINLLTRETTIVTVSVSAIGNHGSTLTATVSGTGNSVTPTEIIGVPAGTPAMFRVTAGFDAGTAMLMLTARHPDYDSTSTEVDVRVDLRSLELSVEPSPLEVVIGTSKVLTIGVSATEGVTLTVTVDRDDRIEGLAAEYLLMSDETSMTIEVIGNAIGDTTLTIEAEAEGYTSATTTVSIEVLDLLRIKAMPATFELAEDASTQISVGLNRIDAVRDTVTVMIEPEGSGLTVSPSSLTFSRSSLRPQFITVDTTTDRTYTGDRSRMLTLTARGYATTMVTVDIIENTPQPIKLEVLPTELRLVRFTSTMIGVRVDIDADLMVKAEGAVRLVGDVPTSLIGSTGVTQIQIQGESVGEGNRHVHSQRRQEGNRYGSSECYRDETEISNQ